MGRALNAETKKASYSPGWFTCWIFILIAALLAPLYFLQCKSGVSRVWHLPFGAWLLVLREIASDILKLAVMLKFGFYFKDQAKRRVPHKFRRRDALHITVLWCLLFAALLPWYVFILALALKLFIYAWEMREIRTDERLMDSRLATARECTRRNPASLMLLPCELSAIFLVSCGHPSG